MDSDSPRARGTRARGLLVLLLLAGAAPAQDPQPASTPQQVVEARAHRAEREGRFAEAAELFLRLVQEEPGNPEWAVAAGRCLGRAGRFNDAMDLLEKARSKFPDVLDIPAMLARTYLLKAEKDERGRGFNARFYFGDAARLAEEILRANPDHRDARLILAQAKYMLGEFEAAVEHAEEAARRHPDHPGAPVLLGTIAFERFRALRSILIEQKPTGQAQADLIYEVDKYRKKTRSAFEKAIELDPDRAFSYQQLGDLEAWDGRIHQALERYAEAMTVDPEARINHEWLADNVPLDERLAMYRKALEGYYERPAPDDSKAATVRWYVAKCLLDQKEYAEAQSQFERVLEVRPDYETAAYYGSVAAYWANDHDAAEKLAARYAASSPAGYADTIRRLPANLQEEMTAVVQYLADRSFAGGRIGRSRDLNQVLAYLRNTADAWNNVAFLCRETGEFEDSLAAYQRALELEPDSPQLLNDAAVILQYHLPGEENLETARDMYRRAITEAERVLGDPDATDEAKARAAQARQDARANLAKMGQ